MSPADLMRATTWMFLLGLVGPGSASAEVRKTTEEVQLRKRPGERAAVVAKLTSGTELEVVREEGRWLLVRVAGSRAEGYLTRTTVTPGEPPPPREPTWSASRRAGGTLRTELFVEVTAAAATLRATPEAKAAAVATSGKGTRLAVVDAASHAAWVHVRDDAGHDGWIARGEVTDGATAVSIGSEVRAPEVARAFRRGPARRLALRTELGFGMRSLGMDLTSNADGGLANYIVDAQAIAATLDVDVTLQAAGRWFLGFDALAQGSNASPGLDYPGPTSAPGSIAFRTFAADLGVRGGLHARREIDVALRLGAHYDAFLPAKVDNVGTLPRERLIGVTAGVRTDIAPPTSRFSAAVRLDVMVLGARAQTSGLEDGTASTAHGLWGGMTVRYAWSPRWHLFAGFDFARASTAWTGQSMREPRATSTRRTDQSQVLQLGLGADL